MSEVCSGEQTFAQLRTGFSIDVDSSPGAAKDFFPNQPPVQTLLQSPYSPLCAIISINICAHVKNPKTLAVIRLFEYTKILHTLTGVGSAALVATVPYPIRRPEFPARDK